MAEPSFSYDDLDRNVDEIRLISLHPSEEQSAQIKCDIIHSRLYDHPKYEALSYVWGSVIDHRPIQISGKDFQVGHNLYYALLQLRHKRDRRLLWVDAICIDQENTFERNHQVSHMSTIYASAEQVVISLGRATDFNYAAILFLEGIGNWSIAPYDPVFKLQWRAVSDLCDLEYWGRLWIIQEVAVASYISVYCGDAVFSWTVFERVCERLLAVTELPADKPNYSRYFLQDSIPVKLIQRRLDFNLMNRKPPLVDLLSKFESPACKDYRDRIFGLRSMSLQCCQDEVIVDYSKPITEIYNSAFTHFIEFHRPEYILSSLTYMCVRYRHHLACGKSMKHSSESTSTVIYTAQNKRMDLESSWHDEGTLMKIYLDTLWLYLNVAPSSSAMQLVSAWNILSHLYIRQSIHNLYQILQLHSERYLPIEETTLFLADNGMFGFAPSYLTPGDIISTHLFGGNNSLPMLSKNIKPTEVRISRPVTSDTLKIMTAVKLEGECPDWKFDVPSKISTKLHSLLILVSK